ncbi:AraC family transcriptional regulator [Paraburkholderia lycopersici]|uniref:AraC family transcriptional regulator n=1 Tax=Paraburkholderia lycopersici TaxID=416944 RepID=A0A1G6TYD6_9BURK|nr:AraC family transcriptional regulator [Paraburkholderia lycopersici]
MAILVSKPIPILNFRDDTSRLAVLRSEAVRASALSGWRSLYFEHREDGLFETVEHVILEHYLMVKLNPMSKANRVLDGTRRLEIQRRGTTAFIPSGCSHRVQYSTALGSLHLITLEQSIVDTVASEMGLGRVNLAPHFAIEEDHFVLEAAELIDAELANGNPHGKLFAETFARTLAGYIVTRYRGAGKTNSKLPSINAVKLGRLDRFIEANIALPIGLADLASQMGLSEYYFCRSFKQATGTSPYQYLLKKRIEHACACLKRDDMSIQDVAFASGFGDPVQFSKQFRRACGFTPSVYRARHVSKGAAFVSIT